jgi:hypothetical protein
MTTLASPPADQRPNPLNRFLLGAAPPAIATFAAMWQLLQPFMPEGHKGFLYVAVLIAWTWPLTIWLGCKVDAVVSKFTKSDQAAAALAEQRHRDMLDLIEARHGRTVERIERLSNEMFVFVEGVEKKQEDTLEKLECVERSLKGLHRHLDLTDKALDEVTKEVEHLRNLVLGNEVPSQRRGPRPLS